MLKMIVATDLNGAIGYNNQLLCRIKEDMVRFKSLTMNSTVVMGSKTLMSLPNSAPLKNRKNIIITSNPDRYKEEYQDYNNIEFTSNIDDIICKYMMAFHDDAWIIGGKSIYELFEPYCSLLYLTLINHKFENADKFFFKDNRWNIVKCEEFIKSESSEYSYSFRLYSKFNKLFQDANLLL